MGIFKRFFPKEYAESVFDINYKELRARGIIALIFDLDNTLAPHDVKFPDERAKALFAELFALGFKCCFLSNNRSGERVRVFAEDLGGKIPVIARANKPSTKGLKRALDMMGAKAENAAIIGDQIFTDIWCGNRAGVTSILTKPLSRRDEFTVKLKRPLEKPVLRAYEKYTKKNGEH